MDNLLEFLNSDQVKKTKTNKKIAHFILQNQTLCTTLNLKEFSRMAGVSEGSVVNFSRSLHYDGFTHLKVGIAQMNGRFASTYSSKDNSCGTLDDISQEVQLSLQATANIINEQTLQVVAEKLHSVNGRIFVCGKSTSAYIGNILAGYLARLQLPAFFSDDAYNLARSCSTSDVVIAISYSGLTIEILKTIQRAKEKGAYTLCITAFKNSELAKACDDALIFTTTESKNGQFPIVARIVQLALCDALCSKICTIKDEAQQ